MRNQFQCKTEDDRADRFLMTIDLSKDRRESPFKNKFTHIMEQESLNFPSTKLYQLIDTQAWQQSTRDSTFIPKKKFEFSRFRASAVSKPRAGGIPFFAKGSNPFINPFACTTYPSKSKSKSSRVLIANPRNSNKRCRNLREYISVNKLDYKRTFSPKIQNTFPNVKPNLKEIVWQSCATIINSKKGETEAKHGFGISQRLIRLLSQDSHKKDNIISSKGKEKKNQESQNNNKDNKLKVETSIPCPIPKEESSSLPIKSKIQQEKPKEVKKQDQEINKFEAPPKIYTIKAKTRIEKLWYAIIKLRRFNLKPKELVTNDVFSKTPYQKEFSRELIMAVKLGEAKTVSKYLNTNRYLIYDFDYVRQTPLHWAVKRGHLAIANMLLKEGANIDAIDMMGRTPLFFAVKNDFVEIIKLLIYYQADPFIATKNGKRPRDVTKNPFAKMYLKKAQMVSVLLRWVKPFRRILLWSKWINYIFHDPFAKPNEATAELNKIWSK